MSNRLPQIRIYTLTTAGVDELAIASGDTIRVRRASTPAAAVNVTFEGDAQSFVMMLGERFGHAGQACRIRVAWTAQAGEWLELIVGTADAAGAFDVPPEAAGLPPILDAADGVNAINFGNDTTSVADVTLYTVPTGRTLILDALQSVCAQAVPAGQVLIIHGTSRYVLGYTYASIAITLPFRWRLPSGWKIAHNNGFGGGSAIYTVGRGRLF